MTIQKSRSKIKKSILRFLIVNLWSISIVLISGCNSAVYENLELSDHKPLNWEKPPLPLITNQSVLYKMEMTVYGNYFSGMMIFKAMLDSSIRINLITESGLKLFDFELKDNKFKEIFVLKQLDKKLIINTLENDLRLILTHNQGIAEQKTFCDKANGQIIIKAGKKRKPLCYIYTYPQDTLVGLKHFKGNKALQVLEFKYNANNIPSELSIKHKNIKLEFVLHLLNKN